MKVKIFIDDEWSPLDKQINDFIKDKNVIDIKYPSDRAMVLYEDKPINSLAFCDKCKYGIFIPDPQNSPPSPNDSGFCKLRNQVIYRDDFCSKFCKEE